MKKRHKHKWKYDNDEIGGDHRYCLKCGLLESDDHKHKWRHNHCKICKKEKPLL